MWVALIVSNDNLKCHNNKLIKGNILLNRRNIHAKIWRKRKSQELYCKLEFMAYICDLFRYKLLETYICLQEF